MRLFGFGKPFLFRFYRAGWTDYSDELVSRIKTVLNEKIPRLYDLEVIDVFFKPDVARADGAYATPMLIKLQPAPVQKIFGSLNDEEELKKALTFLEEEKKKLEQPDQQNNLEQPPFSV